MTLKPMRDGIIAEIAKPEIQVPTSDGIDIGQLTEGDANPMFVTLPVIRVGLSRNKRYYSQEVLREIDSQIKSNKPGGILGHVSDDERSTRFDIPSVIWIGSQLQGDTLYAKGYVPPSATTLREYLRVAKTTGHRISTSIYGQWPQQFDAVQNHHVVVPGGTLESIDFAPPARAGMDLEAQVVLTSEMQEGDGKVVVKELDEAGQRRLQSAIMDAMAGEIDGAEPGTYIVIRASGTTRIPTPGEDAGIMGEGGSSGDTDPKVQVSIEASHENWSGSEGGTMERLEVVKTLTLAEMEHFPAAITSNIEGRIAEAKKAGTLEVLQSVAELLNLDVAKANQPTIIAAIAEMRNEHVALSTREAQRLVNEKIDALLAENVKGEGPKVATAHSMVRRIVTSEMKSQTVEEAERAVVTVLADETVQAMIGSLVATPAVPANVDETPAAPSVPVSEMNSNGIRPIVQNHGANLGGGSGSKFGRTKVTGLTS